MKLHPFAICILLAAFITGCDDGSSDHDGIPKYKAENYQGMLKEIDSASFYCGSYDNCPENVGYMLANQDGYDYSPTISQCTAFLVADDIVGTNSHCIPDRLKNSYTSCENQIAIRFLRKNGEKNIFGCLEIIDFSDDGDAFDPDYAFFRTNPTGILPIGIHKGGLTDNQPITIPKATPLSYSIGARLEVESCKVGLGTLINPYAVNSWSKTGLGLECDGKGGNSGSPVLNQSQQVIGILQGMLKKDFRTVLRQMIADSFSGLPDRVPPHIIFTNFSCIADPVIGSLNQEKCEYSRGLSLFDCNMFDENKANSNVREVYRRWGEDLPEVFMYEYVTNVKTSITLANPICVKPEDSLTNYENFVTSSKSLLGARTDKIELTYPKSITLSPKYSVDQEYRLDPEIRFSEKERLDYKVELKKQGNVWSGLTRSTYSNWRTRLGFSNTEIPMTIPICTDQQLGVEEVVKYQMEDGEVLTSEEYREYSIENGKEDCAG